MKFDFTHFTKDDIKKYHSLLQSVGVENYHGDKRDGRFYDYEEENDNLIKAINIAISTGRPLLLKGASGCGKSSVAFNIARIKEWRYYEFVVNSKSEYNDLLYHFDLVKRLADAQGKNDVQVDSHYIIPNLLWWSMDPKSAKDHIEKQIQNPDQEPVVDPGVYGKEIKPDSRAVILIDEIDKAEPDFPNSLLIPLGSYQFFIKETHTTIAQDIDIPFPLIIITTNEERDLPIAFLRRCIVCKIDEPKKEKLVRIANQVFGKEHSELIQKSAEFFTKKIQEYKDSTKVPDIAEFLDTVKVCLDFHKQGIDIQELFDEVANYTIQK